jgi:hypothetical protein
MIRRLLRETGRPPVVHLWKADQQTACGRSFETITATWDDDDRKVTCPECEAIRDHLGA